MSLDVRSVSFDPDSGGWVFDYVDPATDVRDNGLVANHALLIPCTPQCEPMVEEIRYVVTHVLNRALIFFASSDPVQPEPDDPDDPGPYDNPEER